MGGRGARRPARCGIAAALADAVIGTSAGAFVGAEVAAGRDLEDLFAAQLQPAEQELAASASEDLYAEWVRAFELGGADREAVGAGFGRIALAYPEPVAPEARRAVVEAQLSVRDWPHALRVTAIDADTGALEVLDASSDVLLLDAVSASGAVPGVWPLQRIGGRAFTDGGMVSTANARVAAGFARVLVIAPMPDGHGEIPGAAEDVAVLQRHAEAALIAPDAPAQAAIGPNPYDPDRRAPAARAGRLQGAQRGAGLAAFW